MSKGWFGTEGAHVSNIHINRETYNESYQSVQLIVALIFTFAKDGNKNSLD